MKRSKYDKHQSEMAKTFENSFLENTGRYMMTLKSIQSIHFRHLQKRLGHKLEENDLTSDCSFRKFAF